MKNTITNGIVEKTGKQILKELREIILSTDLINKSIESIENTLNGMTVLEVVINLDSVTKKIQEESKEISAREDSKMVRLLIEDQEALEALLRSDKNYEVKEIADVLTSIYIHLERLRQLSKDNKKDLTNKVNKICKYMFVMLNSAVITG